MTALEPTAPALDLSFLPLSRRPRKSAHLAMLSSPASQPPSRSQYADAHFDPADSQVARPRYPSYPSPIHVDLGRVAPSPSFMTVECGTPEWEAKRDAGGHACALAVVVFGLCFALGGLIAALVMLIVRD